jgi:DNA-binding XRE family transcriptional regulator
MADLKYKPVRHDHEAFLEKARSRHGFQEAYDALEAEYVLAREMLAARTRAGLTQDAVAVRMGTTKSAVSRLEAAGKHTPSLASLRKYAEAVGCTLEVKLVPQEQREAPSQPVFDRARKAPPPRST